MTIENNGIDGADFVELEGNVPAPIPQPENNYFNLGQRMVQKMDKIVQLRLKSAKKQRLNKENSLYSSGRVQN